MSNHPYENLREERGAASLQSAPREEEGCLVSLSMPCEAMSSIISVVNDHLAFENSSQRGGDDVATRSLENRARTLPIPELVSDSEDDPADDNVSSDTLTDNGVSSVTMCRICHEGDQEESLVSLCSCSGTMGYLHVSCLEHWLNNKNVDVCELCGQRFPMAAQPSNVLGFFHWVSQGVPREEESCRVSWSSPSSSQCPEARSVRHSPYISNFTESSISPGVNDPPTFANSSLNGGDGDVARSKDDKVPPLGIPELVSDSENDPADDNVSLDKPTGSCNEDGSSEVMCRICREGVEEEPLVSPCSCSGTIGFMHVSCLEHWLNSQNVDVCELCAPREEESCLVPSPCDSRSSMSSAVNDQPAFENSSQKGGDDVAAWSQDNRAPSLPEPELVSDSEDDPTDDNVSSDTPTDNGAGSNGAMCRICHEGYQEEQLVSLCSCSGTMGFVHVSCLERWINEKSVDFCELCGQRFPMAARRGDVLRLCDWHNMFLAWQYAHPGRRILTVPSARVVTLGRTERGNDERAAAEPATSGRRRRR
ncbi:hypothetical protein HPB52_016911 [Rhipicephalus sanguineus]|uniref:RING-CH-type domain-containing protein n=1 Tax=Rhipicephalus sanguineus TaxID=34632 RepID=A0A9D4TAV2_RHISA|nr:hypothetical protein HPB52_016911 [Rhipicephalus sanguineus]